MMKKELLVWSLCVGILCATSCTKSEAPVVEETPKVEEPSKPSEPEAPKQDTVRFVSYSRPDAAQETARMLQSYPAADFVPTGLYLPPMTEMIVKVNRIAGDYMPQLLVGTYLRGPAYNSSIVKSTLLKQGENRIMSEHGGLIYVRHTGVKNAHQAELQFVKGHKQAPFYQKGKTSKEDWKKMLEEYRYSPDAVLFGEKAILVVSRSKALLYAAYNQDELLNVAEQIQRYEEEISGMDSSSPVHEPKSCNFLMVESDDPNYYMAAWNNGTFYNSTNSSAYMILFDPAKMNSWGPWHELGHHHQQSAYKWNGLGEVTVNIYSLYVEKKMGQTPSRLKKDGTWPKIRTYLNQTGTKNYDEIEDLFTKLGMFHQLTMAYGDDFYKKLHKEAREEKPTNSTDVAKKRYFMLKACTISGHDLSQFFKDWGMVGVDAVYNEIAVLGLPKPAVNPSTLEE